MNVKKVILYIKTVAAFCAMIKVSFETFGKPRN